MKKLLAGVALATLLAGSANAATYLFSFSSGGNSGTASIAITASGAVIQLTNTGEVQSAASLLSGVQLFVDDVPLTSSLTSAVGDEINFLCSNNGCGGQGNVRTTSTTGAAADDIIQHWGSATGANFISIATVNKINEVATPLGASGGNPFDLIAGTFGQKLWNASVVGDNPSVNGTGTFTLAFTGLDGAPKITGLNFLLGTGGTTFGGEGGCTGACPTTTEVPEPATWAMMIMGFGGVGAMIRRRRTVFA